MVFSRLLTVLLFSWFCIFIFFHFPTGTLADAGVHDEYANNYYEDATTKKTVSDHSHLLNEIQHLKSKITSLETGLEERSQELNRKNGQLSQLEMLIQEKSDSALSLQKEVDSLKKKRTSDAEEKVGKAHARAGELESQVAILKSKIDLQNKQKEALEHRANEAEKQIKELSAKVGTLDKERVEQKVQIHKLEKAIKVAEDKLKAAQLDAKMKARELAEVRTAWLPHWFMTSLVQCQSSAQKHWNDYGRPTWDVTLQKAKENTAMAQEWMMPHVEVIQSRWIPMVKEHLRTVSSNAEPYVQSVTAKAIEVYNASVVTLTPHVVKTRDKVEPYLKEVKKMSKPYVDQVATITKPHVEKVKVSLKPYTKKVVNAYEKFVKKATLQHHQLQSTIKKTMNEHELLSTFVTNELVWFLASFLLALPVYVVYTVLSSLFSKKKKAPARNGHTGHGHRRHKRRHADK